MKNYTQRMKRIEARALRGNFELRYMISDMLNREQFSNDEWAAIGVRNGLVDTGLTEYEWRLLLPEMAERSRSIMSGGEHD